MEVNKALVDRIAKLAKLKFNDNETAAIQADLKRMISFVNQLNELNTDHVEPLIYVNESVNVLREDEVVFLLSKEDALSNVPVKDSDYIKVPKMIQK